MKILDKIKSPSGKFVIAYFLGLIVVAFFLRFYKYEEWLFFKWDQSRDAFLLQEAVINGPGELPLLGPRATRLNNGDYLRLGPAYYYFQYLSGAIFNSYQPTAFAYPDLFFSIAILPLFYLFLRLYFKRSHSLLATTLYAFSFLIIQHSRFSWNPNSVPFFALLSFYGLLKFSQSKDLLKKSIWLGVWAFATSMASQFHFFGFFTVLAASGLFFVVYFKLFKFKKIKSNLANMFSRENLIAYLIAIAVIVFTYLPVIISEVKTDFSNTKNFITAFSDKPKEGKTFNQKFIRNFREHGRNYYLLTTSFWTRDGKKSDPIPVSIGLFFSLGAIIFFGIKALRSKEEKDKLFLSLIGFWALTFFIITIPTSYQLRPRYFTVVFPIPFLVLALVFDFLDKKYKKKVLPVIGLLFVVVLTMNIYGTFDWFREQALSQVMSLDTERTYILKKKDGVTLGQLQKITDYLYENKTSDTININLEKEYKMPIRYLMNLKDPSIYVKEIRGKKDLYGNNEIFAIETVSGGFKGLTSEIKDQTEQVLSQQQFGQLLVFKLKISQDGLVAPEVIPDDEKSDNKTPRYYIKDIFSNKNTPRFDNEEEYEEE